MSATLRHTVIQRRRHRRDKRRKLRGQLAKAAKAPAGERQAIEARLEKTYALLTAKAQAKH